MRIDCSIYKSSYNISNTTYLNSPHQVEQKKAMIDLVPLPLEGDLLKTLGPREK
jgi:hypothetical protein